MIRIALRTLLVLLAGALVLVLGGVIALRLGAATWVVNLALAAVNPFPGVTLRAAKARGDGISWLELRDLRLTQDDAHVPISVGVLRVRYDLGSLLGDEILVHDLVLVRPRLIVRERPDSSWDVPRVPRHESDSSASAPRKVSIRSFSLIDGGFLARFGAANPDSIAASVEAAGSLDESRLHLTRLAVKSDRSALSGSGTARLSPAGRFEFALGAQPLSFRDLRFLGSRFNRDGEIRFTLKGVVTSPRASPAEYTVRGDFRGLDPGLFLPTEGLPHRIDGKVTLDLSGASQDRLVGRGEVSVFASPQSARERRRVLARALFSDSRARISLESHLGFASVALHGWILPFDPAPSYDLSARVRPLGRPFSPWLERLFGEAERSLTVRLVGRGVEREKADLHALAAIDPRSGHSGLLDSGSAEVRLRHGAAQVRAIAGVSRGMVALNGTATVGPELELRVNRGSIRGVNFASLIGDSGVGSLDAAFTIHSRGTSPRVAWARARVFDAALAYRSHSLQDGRFQLSLDSGAVQVIGDARMDAGSISATLVAHPFHAEPDVSLRKLVFRQLGLAQLLPSARLAGEVSGTGRLRARGRRLRDLELSSVMSLESSQIGEHPLTRARIEAHLVRGRLAFKGNADAPLGRITLAGFARPFDRVPSYALQEARFQEVDLGRILSSERLHTRLAGSFRGEGSGAKPEGATATGLLTLRRSTVNGAAIETGRVEAKLATGKLDLYGILGTQGDSLILNATAYPFAERPRLRVTSDVAVADIAPFLGPGSPEAGGTMRIAMEGEGDTRATMSLRGELAAAGHMAEVDLHSLRTNFGLRDGLLSIDTLALRSSVGTAAGSGVVGLFGPRAWPSDLRVVGRLEDVAPLGPMLGVPRLGLDSGGFTASVRGHRDSLRIEFEAQGGNLEVGSRRIGALQATMSGLLAADHSITTATADLHAERLVMGRTTVREIRVQGTKRGDAVSLRAESVVDPERSARLVTRLYPDSSRLQLDTLEIRVPGDRWALAHPVAVAYGDRIHVDDFVLASRGRQIAINGVVDRRGEQRLEAKVDSLGLGRFADLIGAPEIDGQINGTFKLSGSAADPHAQGGLDLALRSRDKKIGDARGRLDWSTAGLRLNIGIRHSAGDSLMLSGRIPVALSLAAGDSAGLIRRIPNGEIALHAVTDRFRLDELGPLFDPETVRNLRGRLRINASMAGTLERPHLSGDVVLADGAVRIPRLGATYDKGQVRLSLEGREARLTQARLESGGGRLETKGTIHLRGFPDAAFDLHSTLSSFRVAASQDFRSSLSGTLKLSGITAAPVLTGSLQVRSSDVYLQAKNLQHSAEAVELSPADLRTLERRFGYGVAGGSVTARKPLAPWDIGLDVELTENNWLRRRSDPVMAVELGGKVDIRKAPGDDVKVFGEIEPRPGRSFVQVMGRRFELSEGAVNLSGPLEQTTVSLKAEYRAPSTSGAPSVLITTAVRSDTGKLTVSMSSIPAMRSEDILSYLTTGRPASTDPTLESDEQEALTTGASLAVGAALGSVAGGAGQAFGLDVVQVLQDREGGQTLVAGKYVSPPLYLGFRQPIVAATSAVRSDAERDLVEFEVEYATLRQLLLNVQGGGSDLRVFLRLRR